VKKFPAATAARFAALLIVLGAPFTLSACSDKVSAGDDTGAVDADSDGVGSDLDCDDGDAAIFPGAVEVCDGVDNDCDGLVDDADDSLDSSTATVYWQDADGDGYGDPAVELFACVPPSDAALTAGDCDDSLSTVNPMADEVCDGVDNDCDGLADDLDPEGALDAAIWYIDDDGDGYGDPKGGTTACVQPTGTVSDGSDCDDGLSTVNPGAVERCDGVDDDCNDATTDAGLASWQADGKDLVDVTADVSGTVDAPAVWSLDDPGTLRFCDGTFYVGLDVHADSTILGMSGDPTAVTLDAALGGSVIQIEGEGLTVSLSGLTLTDGVGEVSRTLKDGVGGGIFCESLSTVSTLAVDQVHIEGNQAVYGGGLFAHGCETTLTNTDIAANTANFVGGAGWVMNGTHFWTNVDISDNSTGSDVGGVYFYEDSPGLEVVLDQVDVHDNQAPDGVAAGISVYGGSLSWSGSSTSSSGLVGNIADSGAGGIHLDGTDFSASAVDFGEPGTADDNHPADIYLDSAATPYGAGDDATFDCDADACGRSVLHEVGQADTAWNTADGYLIADVFQASTVATIERYLVYGSMGDGCQARGYVLSADGAVADSNVDWTVEWSGGLDDWGTSTAWYYVNDVNVLTEIDRTYALGFVCECTTGAYCYAARPDEGPTTHIDAGFGDGTGMIVQEGFNRVTAYYDGADYLSWFNMRIDVTEL